MENEPLRADEYSLSQEIRLLRRLIDEAPSPSLKQGLILALAKCLAQDEERAIKSNETLAAGAVFAYVDSCMEAVARVLQAELDEPMVFKIVDRISEELAALTPQNTKADLKRLISP